MDVRSYRSIVNPHALESTAAAYEAGRQGAGASFCPARDVRAAIASWTGALTDHGHTSYYGLESIRKSRAYFLGLARFWRSGDGTRLVLGLSPESEPAAPALEPLTEDQSAEALHLAERIGRERGESDALALEPGDTLRDDPLSGEWSGDFTPAGLVSYLAGAMDVQRERLEDLESELCDRFEAGYRSAGARPIGTTAGGPFTIAHVNVDGAGRLEGSFETLEAARRERDRLQAYSDRQRPDGLRNPWGYFYSVRDRNGRAV